MFFVLDFVKYVCYITENLNYINMLENVIIKELKETEESYFVVGENSKKYEIRKQDLGVVTLAVGNPISIIKHPGFPSVIAGLDLMGHRVFHKSREEISDEWLEKMTQSMINALPAGAKHLLAMFEMMTVKFKDYRLAEIVALKLGVELNERIKASSLIDNFAKLPRYVQLMVLPGLDNQLMPTVPVDKIVAVAKAYTADERNHIDFSNPLHLKDSAVMHLANATAERYGEFCQPRSKCIDEYIKSL